MSNTILLERVGRASFVATLILWLCTAPAQAEVFALSDEDWARPPTGERVLQLPAIKRAAQYWSQDTSRRILIYHPGDAKSTRWAAELNDWLVALGINSDRLSLRIGSEPGQLLIEVLSNTK